MANPREQHDVDHSVHEAIQNVAEQTGRAGRIMADVGERTFHAQTEILQRNAEAVQQAMQSGSELASRLTSKSADQFAKAFGVGGNEAESAVQQSAQTLKALVQSSSTLSQNAQAISKQWFDLMHRQIEQGMHHMEALMRARTPQEFVAVQSDVMRDQLNGIIEVTKRAADLSSQAANEASRHISEAADAAKRAA